MAEVTSKISPINVDTSGRGSGSAAFQQTLYTSSKVTHDGGNTFKVEIQQHDNAQGGGTRIIGENNNGTISFNDNASSLIKNNQGLIKRASINQVQSVENSLNIANAFTKEALNLQIGNANISIDDPGPLADYWKNPPNDKFTNFADAIKASQSIGVGGNGNSDCGRSNYRKDLVYPTTLRTRQQDTLRISVLKYKPRGLKGKGFKFAKRGGPKGRTIGAVTLPAPGGINSSNKTEWGQATMSPVQLAMTNAVNAFLDKKGSVDKAVGSLEEAYKQGIGEPEVRQAMQAMITGNITGTQNLLSRAQGKVMNPNMELLFKGPQLRPFGFTYRLSPRDREESGTILKIIRMFKQSMAPQTTQSSLFLKAPSTYKLEFLAAGNRKHSYLPKIKECALEDFTVNYTPDGSYMTYENQSMVAYELTFAFKEIEPIYNNDYSDLDGDSDQSIGY
tara:strand:- start:610 stop:1953 length:1344 start_codon:yes stop_codon:yes gene_type:complete